jgi:hypothetical protein
MVVIPVMINHYLYLDDAASDLAPICNQDFVERFRRRAVARLSLYIDADNFCASV